jgi:hypothetical protein
MLRVSRPLERPLLRGDRGRIGEGGPGGASKGSSLWIQAGVRLLLSPPTSSYSHSPTPERKRPEPVFSKLLKSSPRQPAPHVPALTPSRRHRYRPTHKSKREPIPRHNGRNLDTLVSLRLAIRRDDASEESGTFWVFHGRAFEARPAPSHGKTSDCFSQIPSVSDPDTGNRGTGRFEARVGFVHSNKLRLGVDGEETKFLRVGGRDEVGAGDGSHGHAGYRNQASD